MRSSSLPQYRLGAFGFLAHPGSLLERDFTANWGKSRQSSLYVPLSAVETLLRLVSSNLPPFKTETETGFDPTSDWQNQVGLNSWCECLTRSRFNPYAPRSCRLQAPRRPSFAASCRSAFCEEPRLVKNGTDEPCPSVRLSRSALCIISFSVADNLLSG